MKVFVHSVGLLGPGLVSWQGAQGVLRGSEPHGTAKTVLLAPARLPPAERRRAGDAIKLAMGVADEAVTNGALDPQTLATVFASSSGEGTNCHTICETLASDNRLISPTRFSNSVHNSVDVVIDSQVIASAAVFSEPTPGGSVRLVDTRIARS